ncbi:uncharacterized protein CPUR_08777 [Claviceps purpurea 20.1]|uniref:Uncharacterized protein n=1 Tax=Claviceps purpurea (strain 20.1) TaxID=1111077 RepID=M1WGT4_CLAP2|nr:uncharacterized protein CPUR_08777 [Claviceps purpurea 20.1]
MLKGANLPSELWPESVQAATYLYNISPSQRLAWQTPIQVLETWFRDNAQLPIRAITADLRPDWSGVYAYGCRAYPVSRDREADRNRRWFKTNPRGHIGYLVGYVASNVYRVWIPSLGKVMTTRNVTFNESIFYDAKNEEQEAQSIPELKTQYVLLQIDSPNVNADFSLLPGVASSALILSESSNSGVNNMPVSERVIEETPAKLGKPQQFPSQASHDQNFGLRTPEPTPEPISGDSITQEGQHHHSLTENETSYSAPDVPEQLAQVKGGVNEPASGEGETTPQGESNAPSDSDKTIETRMTEKDNGPTEQSQNPQSSLDDGGLATLSIDAQEDDPAIDNSSQNPQEESSSQGTRKSSRIRKMKDEGKIQDWSILRKRNPDLHLSNFLWDPSSWLKPDQLKAEDEEYQEVKTVFSVFDAHCDSRSRANLNEKLLKKAIHQADLVKVPTRYSEALNHPLSAEFIQAMKDEVLELSDRGTWKVVKRQSIAGKPIPLKWVFQYKFNEKGILVRCKARLCVRGDLQEKSTIERTYAATLAAHAFRIFIALAARFDLDISQFDVKNAFTHATRGKDAEPIICELPEGFKIPECVVLLLKALYGLRESPQMWFEELTRQLKALGLIPSDEEPCLFYTEARDVFLIFFVDDILVAYHRDNKDAADRIIAGLKKAFELDDRGEARFFLGIEIIRDRPNRTIYLSHEAYINKLGEKFNQVERATFPAIPIPVIEYRKSDIGTDKATIKAYQEKIGSILYTAIMIRPDVAFAASKLSQFLTNPSPEHMKAADQTIRYLVLTKHLALRFGGVGEMRVIQIASDASFADDLTTRRSSQGYLITLFGGPVIWKATRQLTVTTSTTEAELLALQLTAKETIALQRLFRDIRFNAYEDWVIHCDNHQTIRLVLNESERINTRLRHVDIHQMWLKQEFKRGSFKIDYLPTAAMPADGFTKALNRQQFEKFRSMLSLVDTRNLIRTSPITEKDEQKIIQSTQGAQEEATIQKLRA